VALGATLADDLGVHVGDKLRITSSEQRTDVVSVSGIFALGNSAVDKTWVITSLRHAQALFALPGGATSIELKIGDVFQAESTAALIHDRTGLDADSWMKLNAELLSGLSAQSSSKSMIQFFVVVAVALGIASVLIVSVVQKSREIGILRAVGTQPRRVLMVFLIQGGVLGFIGALLGCALGALFAKLFESLALGPDGRPRFPVQLSAGLFVSATVMATCVGLLAAAIPARRAARLDPAVAIRSG
jgi:lipoprotein-releasing system permease protein